MTDQPRNWDKELAEIDRAIEKQAASAPRGGPPAPTSGAPAAARYPGAPEGAPAKGSVALTWFWVVLALLLAVAMPLWPYGKDCGLQLFFYLGATTLALLAGVAAAISTWATRRALGHVIALLAVTWAAVLAGREVLPRVGYALERKSWLCPAIPEPAPPAARPERAPPAAQPDPVPPSGQPETASPAPETPGAPIQSSTLQLRHGQDLQELHRRRVGRARHG